MTVYFFLNISEKSKPCENQYYYYYSKTIIAIIEILAILRISNKDLLSLHTSIAANPDPAPRSRMRTSLVSLTYSATAAADKAGPSHTSEVKSCKL